MKLTFAKAKGCSSHGAIVTAIFTTRIRTMREGAVFTGVCVSSREWEDTPVW